MTLAAWAVRRLGAPVVAITGSVGKTTTKDLAARRDRRRPPRRGQRPQLQQRTGLARHGARRRRRHRGPRARDGHARVRRDRPACAVAPPTIGVVTRSAPRPRRTGRRDRGGGPRQGRARRGAPARRHRDAQRRRRRGCGRWPSAPSPTCCTFGESRDADVRVEQIDLDDLARATSASTRRGAPTRSASPSAAGTWRSTPRPPSPPPGCAASARTTPSRAIAGDARCRPSRMRVHQLARGAIVVDDAYNANPTSMRAGLDALAAIDARRRVAVLGVMAELAEPQAAHREIAEHAAEPRHRADRRRHRPLRHRAGRRREPRHSVRSRRGRPCS